MNERIYNEQTIKEYLLGTMSEVESERLDELSFTNDEFADALGVREKELVDSYIQRELSEEDLERFETYFLASPLRRKRVDFARAFQSFGERTAGPSVAVTSAAVKTGWLSTLFSPRPVLQWTFALTTLVIIVTAGWLFVQNTRLRREIDQTQASRTEVQQRELELQKQIENQRVANSITEEQLARERDERARLEEQVKSVNPKSSQGFAIASLILTPTMRGTGQVKSVTISPNTERLAIQLELEPNNYSTYITALVDQSGGQTLWRSPRIKAATSRDRKSLRVNFSTALLGTGIYRMQVSGVADEGAPEAIGDYSFRVVKQ